MHIFPCQRESDELLYTVRSLVTVRETSCQRMRVDACTGGLRNFIWNKTQRLYGLADVFLSFVSLCAGGKRSFFEAEYFSASFQRPLSFVSRASN